MTGTQKKKWKEFEKKIKSIRRSEKMSKKIIETKLLCPRCRNCTTIFRNKARQKGEGHYKKLYCYNCKSTHNHIELKTNYNYTNEEIDELIEKIKADSRL